MLDAVGLVFTLNVQGPFGFYSLVAILSLGIISMFMWFPCFSGLAYQLGFIISIASVSQDRLCIH